MQTHMHARTRRLLALVALPVAPLALLVTSLLTPAPASAQGFGFSEFPQSAVIQNVVTDELGTFTTDPIRNVGQVQHLFLIRLPNEAGAAAGLNIVCEVAADPAGATWFPLGTPVTDVPLVNGSVFLFIRYTGVFRGIRVRSTVVPPSELSIDYVGTQIPVFLSITPESDRFVF